LASRSPAAITSHLGRLLLRLALGLLFLSVGLQLLTPYEASRVSDLAQGSPLVGWCYRLWGVRGAGAVFGVAEILAGAGILSGFWRAGALPARLGAFGAVAVCLVTTSFLFTAPGVVAGRTVFHLPLISMSVGQFLAKDVVILAASLMLLGESFGGRR
jgi:uncharacterized membrane protein YkgB